MLSRALQNLSHRKAVVTLVLVATAFVCAILFFQVQPVFANGAPLNDGDTFGVEELDENLPLANTDIRIIIGKIIRAALGFLGVIALGIILYAGYTIMTAAGNEEKVLEGRKILINGVIGMVIILSAFTITQFVLNALNDAINGRSGGDGRAPIFETFSGSAGLGRVIRDHYPFRDETGVKRNTKVVITFAEPIDPSTIIENTNNTCWGNNGTAVTCTPENSNRPYFGDCNADAVDFNYQSDCDRLQTEALQLFLATDADSKDKVYIEGTVSALYQDGDDRNVYTIVFRPFDYLGTEGETVRYGATVTNAIKKKNGDELFKGQISSYYTWQFETDGELDLSAPTVIDINPEQGSSVARNEYIQINFNEPVDPTMVQGLVSNANNAFTEPSHIKFNLATPQPSPLPSGEWKITNGYKTVEFHSDIQCGLNSCGEPLYCMPVSCETGACDTAYGVLLKTAALVNVNTFESVPFSGVMDMAGNALDGDADGVPDGKPVGSTVDEQSEPDNYYFNFIIKNEIDREAPYIEAMLPAIDKEQVIDEEPVRVRFSRKMLYSSLIGANISLEEYPVSYSADGATVEFWSHPDSKTENISIGGVIFPKTLTTVKHRVFGPNGLDFYYFSQLSNGVRASNGNCLHPGRGPLGNAGTNPLCVYSVDNSGVITQNSSCTPVVTKNQQGGYDRNNDTGCVIDSSLGFDYAQADIASCVEELKSGDVSPL